MNMNKIKDFNFCWKVTFFSNKLQKRVCDSPNNFYLHSFSSVFSHVSLLLLNSESHEFVYKDLELRGSVKKTKRQGLQMFKAQKITVEYSHLKNYCLY